MSKMLVRSPGGSARREVPLDSVEVPDLWHIAQWLKENREGKSGEMVLECWHLCHDLLLALKEDPKSAPFVDSKPAGYISKGSGA